MNPWTAFAGHAISSINTVTMDISPGENMPLSSCWCKGSPESAVASETPPVHNSCTKPEVTAANCSCHACPSPAVCKCLPQGGISLLAAKSWDRWLLRHFYYLCHRTGSKASLFCKRSNLRLKVIHSSILSNGKSVMPGDTAILYSLSVLASWPINILAYYELSVKLSTSSKHLSPQEPKLYIYRTGRPKSKRNIELQEKIDHDCFLHITEE